ncbi:MAG: carboxylating nicotinate-nucleotide diphosphorylase [Chloroflexota bacterium]|nr:carboxylating nicotinate-nucleotide diphosphorylase [Chloroflexota bacterium]
MTEPGLPPGVEPFQLDAVVDRALAEDLGWGDLTTTSLVPPDLQGQAAFLVKGRGVLAGMGVAGGVFKRVDPSLRFHALLPDGSRVEPGQVAGRVEGAVVSILKGERTALNFLQRLSGIATTTARFVEAVAGLPVRIIDTRKTTPGLRLLEKYAVRVGGGHNHRSHLGDGILIKDNHLAALRRLGLGVGEAVARARRAAPHTLRVQVEVQTYDQAVEALEARAEALLLDNMPPSEMRRVVEMARGRALLEASGGIALANIRAVAETGVDLISLGALTHSAGSLDISLELEV